MTTVRNHRHALFILTALVLGLVFLIACSTQAPDTTPTAGSNAPAGSQVSFDSSDQVNRSLQGSSLVSAVNGSLDTGIHVTGQGQASGTPDLAYLNLGVESFAGSVQQARDAAATAMDQVLSALRDSNIAEEDLQTSYFNINPRYTSREVTRCLDGSQSSSSQGSDPAITMPREDTVQIAPAEQCFQEREQVISGYQVNNQLTVKVHDLDNLGNIIDRVTEAGGNLIRFNGVQFSIEDTQELQRQARAAAVEDLRSKASQLAQLNNVELGSLIAISESGGQAPLKVTAERLALDSAYAASPATQIQSGQLDVLVTVQGVFAIQ